MGKVLVTGATGLLGRTVVEKLAKNNFVYRTCRDMSDRELERADSRKEIVDLEVDLSGYWDTSVLPGSIDAVVHLAQSSRFREFPEKALDVFGVNVQTTQLLLDYAYRAGARKFIYASSGGVYGAGKYAFSENSPIVGHGDLGYYLASKLCGEVLAHNYAGLLDICVLRFFFIYGKKQSRTMLLPRLVDNVRDGREILLQGRNGIIINPIHVTDAACSVERALDVPGSNTFNVAGPDNLTLREIADTIGRKVGVAPVFRYSDEEPNNLIGDIEAMKTSLHDPAVRFLEGVTDLL